MVEQLELDPPVPQDVALGPPGSLRVLVGRAVGIATAAARTWPRRVEHQQHGEAVVAGDVERGHERKVVHASMVSVRSRSSVSSRLSRNWVMVISWTAHGSAASRRRAADRGHGVGEVQHPGVGAEVDHVGGDVEEHGMFRSASLPPGPTVSPTD